MQDDTREQLVETATRLFATRGFYGASIANIADELGLTKQALLHHFGRKEKLYSEVLARISKRMQSCVESACSEHDEPAEQLFAALTAVYQRSVEAPHESRIIMRELLDSERRIDEVHSWYLKPFLDALTDMTRAAATDRSLSRSDALTLVYPILGAMSYFVVSDVVLQQMYGKANWSRMQKGFPHELDKQVRHLVNELVAP